MKTLIERTELFVFGSETMLPFRRLYRRVFRAFRNVEKAKRKAKFKLLNLYHRMLAPTHMRHLLVPKTHVLIPRQHWHYWLDARRKMIVAQRKLEQNKVRTVKMGEKIKELSRENRALKREIKIGD